MATADERVLALAVARGLLEPGIARDADLKGLVASGQLSEAARRRLALDLADMEADEANHWSVEIMAGLPPDGTKTPTDTEPDSSTGGSFSAKGFRQGSVFQAQRLDQWGRFEALELLGEGGMGRIFRAMDPRLHRAVALKLLRRDDPGLLQRFLQEAQLQARVDHPNVCRVYEVGEWRGQPYIAMQFLRGETLQNAAPDLPLEALLRHMIEVCEGVHAAHRVGLVHRDLKPANLMIDHSGDGSTHACVLDFGLARGAEGGRGLTETGQVMGTLSYMSPEQVRGNTALLDRRSDVYSLGATLHALLAEAPPFAGDGLECMSHIVKDDPAPLRRLVPTLPVELETVVLTCLQKDPRRRYQTARALGEDLQRILDGEPIQARPTTAMERLLRWARKRRALVAASAAVCLSMALFGGLAMRERLRARAQAAHAQRFAQAAERIEALARFLRLQPARDLTQDHLDLRSRVQALAQEVMAAGPLAEAPGAYALGRAHLALDDPAGARTHLEHAWALGFRAPEAAHALGRALASIYQGELGKAYALPDPGLRKRRLEELNITLREPAADWLRRGASASLEPPAFRSGLLALMEGQPQEVVRLAKEAQSQAPWFYESLRLEAEARLAQAHGANTAAEAEPALQTAGRLLTEAEGRAPCDVDLLRLDIRRWQEMVALGWQFGADPKAPVLAQVAVADRWAALEPAAAQPLAWRARARGEMARFLAFREIDPADWLAQAKADASEALHRDLNEVEAWTAQASILRTEGFRQLSRGEDPTACLKDAITAADAGLRLDPGHIVLQNIRYSALLFWIDATCLKGTYARSAVLPYLQEARAMAAAHPEEAYFLANFGSLAQAAARAEAASGGDPTEDAEEAVRAYEAGLKAQPHHVGFHRGILLARAAQARALARNGQDPRLRVDQARAAFQKARDEQAPLATLAPNFMDCLISEAAYVSAQGGDPTAPLDEAGRLLPLLDARAETPVELGAIQLRYFALVLHQKPQPRFQGMREKGQILAQSLIRMKPMDPDFWTSLARFQDACGQRAEADKARARARTLNPRKGAS